MHEYLDPDKLWAVMKMNDVSPTDLIDKLGVEARTIGKWLVGEATPQRGTMHHLLNILGVTRDKIMSSTES